MRNVCDDTIDRAPPTNTNSVTILRNIFFVYFYIYMCVLILMYICDSSILSQKLYFRQLSLSLSLSLSYENLKTVSLHVCSIFSNHPTQIVYDQILPDSNSIRSDFQRQEVQRTFRVYGVRENGMR